jgi:diguanylate cyclase
MSVRISETGRGMRNSSSLSSIYTNVKFTIEVYNMQIIRDLFVNGAIIVSAITFTNLLLRDRFDKTSILSNLIYGFLSGLLGCVLMLFSISVSPIIIIDFRYIPVIVMALYFSPIAAIVSTLMIGLFRILYFGVSIASIIAIIVVVIICIVSCLVGRTKATFKIKWLLTGASICIIPGIGIYYLIQTFKNRLEIMLVYLIKTKRNLIF